MSKFGKSNSSGKKRSKTNKTRTKHNGTVTESNEKELDTNVSKVQESETQKDGMFGILNKEELRETPNNLRKSSSELFNSIHSGDTILKLPNRSWSIHCTSSPEKCIVISEMVVTGNSDEGLVPMYTKQIIFNERMNYEVLLLNSKALIRNELNATTISEVMRIVSYVNDLKLCAGGPEVSVYCNVNPECAYRDYKERWRHNLCSLEISEGESCESCLSLEEILKRHVQRGKSRNAIGSGKRKRIE